MKGKSGSPSGRRRRTSLKRWRGQRGPTVIEALRPWSVRPLWPLVVSLIADYSATEPRASGVLFQNQVSLTGIKSCLFSASLGKSSVWRFGSMARQLTASRLRFLETRSRVCESACPDDKCSARRRKKKNPLVLFGQFIKFPAAIKAALKKWCVSGRKQRAGRGARAIHHGTLSLVSAAPAPIHVHTPLALTMLNCLWDASDQW